MYKPISQQAFRYENLKDVESEFLDVFLQDVSFCFAHQYHVARAVAKLAEWVIH